MQVISTVILPWLNGLISLLAPLGAVCERAVTPIGKHFNVPVTNKLMIQHLVHLLSIIMTSNLHHRLTRGAPVCFFQQLHRIRYLTDEVTNMMLSKPIKYFLCGYSEGKAAKSHHWDFFPSFSTWVVLRVQV